MGFAPGRTWMAQQISAAKQGQYFIHWEITSEIQACCIEAGMANHSCSTLALQTPLKGVISLWGLWGHSPPSLLPGSVSNPFSSPWPPTHSQFRIQHCVWGIHFKLYVIWKCGDCSQHGIQGILMTMQRIPQTPSHLWEAREWIHQERASNLSGLDFWQPLGACELCQTRALLPSKQESFLFGK